MKFHLTRGWSLPFLSVFWIIAFLIKRRVGGGAKHRYKHHHTLLFFRQNNHSSKIINMTIVFSRQEILITRVWFLSFCSSLKAGCAPSGSLWKARRQRTSLIQTHFTLAFDLGKSVPPEIHLFPHSCSRWLFNYWKNYDLPSLVLGAEAREMLKEVQAVWELTVQWYY